ncbi:MAG: dihydroorotate dehydrogenase electron transfer subunit [Rhodopirellula sp.]|nr:dihydroorotate dehydrogenase electron transfer subunit [Rhodopirellula sp.]
MGVGYSTHDLAGFVPTASECRGQVVENRCVATDTWLMRLSCPELARQVTPGQFFMVRDPRVSDPMLGRPFALLDVWEDSDGKIAGVDFGYVVVGKMTTRMTTWRAGDPCSLWGPLGNGFPVPDVERLCLVAGGIGVTPFLAVTNEALGNRIYRSSVGTGSNAVKSVSLCYGTRSKDYLACVDLFEQAGAEVRISTDDGSFGRHGFVTDSLKDLISGETPPQAIYCCGPEPMMHAVGIIAAESQIPCWLSLETPMACGFGICFSCVTRVRMDDGTTDYRRTCVEGPVFPAEKLCFS